MNLIMQVTRRNSVKDAVLAQQFVSQTSVPGILTELYEI